jgi:AcrR family transcriptional regulator
MTKPTVRRRTQEERRAETRARIVQAAVSELRTKGYTGFRVDKVALAADVSRGAQTHHFPTKEVLVLAALESLYSNSTKASVKLAESMGPGDDVLAKVLEDAGRFYMSSHFTIALSMLNLGDHESGLRKKVQAMSRKYRLPIEQAWLAAFVRAGVDEQVAKTVLDLTFAVYRGMVMRRFLRKTGDDTQGLLQQWARIARAYIDGAIPI